MVRQGVEQASIQRFDLFVLDVQTPEVDGLHLCRILKTLQPGVPVVYYVNFSDFPHARDMLAECGNYFLARPVKAAELEQVIRVVLPNEPSSS
jgi:CheY-like chemotaxis protein